MPRTKGSKNKPKTVTADFATQLAEKQSAKEAISAEIASITANIDTLKADLKAKKAALKKVEKWNSGLQVHYSFLFSFLFSVLKIGFVHFIHDAVHILWGQISAGK